MDIGAELEETPVLQGVDLSVDVEPLDPACDVQQPP